MFEGQNIHLSPVDGKRLCSFSQKICKQHRLNGYAFCIRHILEDKNAPFKQCQFKIKANGENCFNPVPSAEERVYCNSHLQVLGMIPKTASKQLQNKKKLSAAALKNNKSKKKGAVATKKKKTGPANAKSASNVSMKMKKKARKILQLEEEEEKGQRSWYAVMRKAFKRTAYNLHSWQKQGLDSEVCDFLKQRKYQRQNEHVFKARKVEDSDSEECEGNRGVGEVDVCQSLLLNSTERVHHNVLHQEPSATQEQKLVAKLKHRQGQLKHAVASRQNQSSLSYSVLSKLVSSTRKNALETTNVLNMESGSTSIGSFKLYRERQEAVTYRVPCALLTGEVRCTKPTLPYCRFCAEHIGTDGDQYLFSSEPCAPSGRIGRPQTLDFLRIIDTPHTTGSSTSTSKTSASQSKRKSDVNTSPDQSKRSQQRSKSGGLDKKKDKNQMPPPAKLKKSTTKRQRGSIRNEMQKKYSIPSQSHQKMNAHLRKTEADEEVQDEDEEEDEGIKGVEETEIEPEQPVSRQDVSNSGESDDDADEDDEAEDILTPEEAFHLPPGSLSFSPRLDDDAMPTMKSRDLEEEDEELLRCASNFPFDSTTQLPRDITSPTLNQLSSTDFTNFDNIFMSPSKTVDSVPDTCRDSTPKKLFSPPPVSCSPRLSSVCRPNSTANNVNNRLTSNETTSEHRDHNGTAGLGREPKGGPNLLKISHVVDAYNNKQTAKAQNATSTLYNNNMRKQLSITTSNSQRSNNAFNSLPNDNVQENKTVPQYRNNQMTPMGNALSNVVTNDSMNTLSKRYLSDSLLMQQPLAQDSTLFDDINTDVESPLEKVNPDIFFSSVFPVSTSTEGI